MTKNIILVIIITTSALLATFITSNIVFYGSRVSEACLIEDCVAVRQYTGLPLKVYEIEKAEGLNCNPDSDYHNYCTEKRLTSPLAVILNFTFFVSAIGLIVYLIRTIIRLIRA